MHIIIAWQWKGAMQTKVFFFCYTNCPLAAILKIVSGLSDIQIAAITNENLNNLT